MTTTPARDSKTPSRLDPEPMARRDVLGLAAKLSALGTCLFALLGVLRLPKAAVLPSPSKKFRVTLPESLPPGEPFIPPGRSVAVFRDAEGVFAISMICTHLGCIVKSVPKGFDCPCHGSRFTCEGGVMRGPAPKPLEWLAVKRTGERTYIIDRGTTVRPGVKETA